MTVVTASDPLHSVQRARDNAVRARRWAFVEAILGTFPLLDIDLPTAGIHAHLFAELSRTETLIDPHDLWLAAACNAHGLAMATFNVREFARRDWYWKTGLHDRA